MAIRRPSNYTQIYENCVVTGKTSKQFKTVKALILDNKVKDIIIATDADEKGKLVARLILIKLQQKPIRRLWISPVTKKLFNKVLKI